MPRAATAFVEFDGDFSKIGRNAGPQAKRLEGTFNSSFRRIATFAAGALAAVGVGKFLKDSFKQAEDAVRVGKLTAAVLKSTGGAANVSAPQVEKLAKSLSAIAGVDDEVIASSENVLLTFTKVRNEVGKGNDIFTQGAKAALDLSSALGTDLQGATIQVGKALNDPIKGITALRRVGVSFTAQQIDQVKALVASGHALDAQKLILRELTTEFGGAAKANATSSAKIGVAFKNIEESLGGLILPLVEKFASFITVTVAPAIDSLIHRVKELGGVARFAFEIGFGSKNIAGIHGWLSIFARLGAVLRGVIDFIKGDVVGAGLELGRAFGLDDQSPTITKTIKALANIRKAIVAVIDFIAKHWKPILIGAAAALLIFTAPVVAVIAGLVLLYVKFRFVREQVARFVDFFKRNWPTISAIAVTVGKALGESLVKVGKVLGPILIDIARGLAAVLGFLAKNRDVALAIAAPLAAMAAAFVALLIVAKVQAAIATFRASVIALNAAFAANPIILVVGAIVALGAAVFLAYKHFKPFHDAVDAAWQILQSTFHWIVKNWPLLLGILTGPIGIAVIFIIRNFDRIKGGFSAVKDWIGNRVSEIVGFFRALPGRILAFHGQILLAALGIGKAIITGIVRGVTGAIGVVSDIGKAIANAAIHFINDRILGSIRGGIRTLANTLANINIPGAGRAFDAASSALNAAASHIPNIPTLHEGGVVTFSNGQGLALLRNGEGVFTPDQMKALGAGVGARTIDARVVNNGTIFTTEDLHALADERDRRLVAAIGAG